MSACYAHRYIEMHKLKTTYIDFNDGKTTSHQIHVQYVTWVLVPPKNIAECSC
jgi:hypothetical protein